jgi:hypothetical protein
MWLEIIQERKNKPMKKTLLYFFVSIAMCGCALQPEGLSNENEKSKKVVCKNEAGMTRCAKVDIDKPKD